MKTLALTILALAACSKPNPYYCEDHPDHNCLIDAAAGNDTGMNSCTQVGCVSGVCDPANGMCVQCTGSEHAACTGTTPVCGSNDTCEPCTADTACAQSNTCMPDGSCADVAGVLYASMTGSGTSCTQQAMCTLDTAITLVDSNHKVIKLAPGTYSNEALQLTTDVTIVGRMATIERGSVGPVITIGSSAHVELDYVTIQTGVGVTGHGVACSSGTMTLHGVTVQNNGGMGISSAGCDVTVERSTFYRNDQGGIDLGGTSSIKFDITNTFITRNGNNIDALFGGLYILPTSVASGRLEFNTIVDNDASTGVTHFGGVTCDILAVSAANNIVARNRKANNATGQQTQGACGFVTSKLQDDVTGLNFINSESVPYNYRIQTGSSVIDQATTASTVDVDVDSHHRPQGMQKDIGASELMP